MSSFRENNDEKVTSTLLRPSPPSSLTSETFEQYVQTLERSLTESKDKLANLLTPEAKREEILQIQKEVMTQYCTTFTSGLSSLSSLLSTPTPSLTATSLKMNKILQSSYLSSIMSTPPRTVLKDKGEMTESEIVNFCEVCVAYVKTEECTKILNDAFGSEAEIKLKIKAVNTSLVSLQYSVMLRLGWDKEWATEELSISRERYSSSPSTITTLNNFIQKMTETSRQIIQSSTPPPKPLSDGVTRVISSSTREVDPENVKVSRMDREKDKEEEGIKSTLKQMKVIEQDILAEIMSWSDDERSVQISLCYQVRSSFLSQISNVPVKERAEFMLTISPEVKRKLMIIKIWEGVEEMRGGKELKRNLKGGETV